MPEVRDGGNTILYNIRPMIDFPSVSETTDKLCDVGKECNVCGRNLGMFPMAPICQHCRPIEQPCGRVIDGIAYSPAGTDEEERIPTSSLRVEEDGSVEFLKGRHKDAVWLDGGPSVDYTKQVANLCLMTETFPVPTYRIRFR